MGSTSLWRMPNQKRPYWTQIQRKTRVPFPPPCLDVLSPIPFLTKLDCSVCLEVFKISKPPYSTFPKKIKPCVRLCKTLQCISGRWKTRGVCWSILSCLFGFYK
ncbi:hypothetical protein FKM82_011022 [Ascaphus truei]